MPDTKKPFMPLSPRQKALDSSARKTGDNLAGYRDGESYEALKDAKGAVGHVESKDFAILKEGIFPWPGKQANPDEVPRYRELMEGEYDAVKNRDRRRDGKPTGYDAAMRGTPATPVSTADAMKAGGAKKVILAKPKLTPAMFEKKK